MKKAKIADRFQKNSERLLEYAAQSAEACAQLLLHFRWDHKHPSAYETSFEAACAPPGSLLASILRGWHDGTSIPLALPFWVALGYTAGHLARTETCVRLPDGSIIQPKLWNILLGPAGCGKTWTETNVGKIFDADSRLDLGPAVSEAAFVEVLARKAKGVWVRDEWAQFQRALETMSSPLAGVRDILLRIYEGQSVSRERARSEPVTVDDPCMSIIGISVDTTFEEILSVESLLDGFSSRFSYCYALPDPKRPWHECPWWTLPEESAEWPTRWRRIADRTHREYSVTPEAFGYFFDVYRREGRRIACDDVPEAFFRRVLTRWHVLALLLHVLSGHESSELDVGSYETAYRALDWTMRDGTQLLHRVTGGAFRRMISDAIRWRDNHPQLPLTRRNLIGGVRSIQSAQSAEFVLRVLAERGFASKDERCPV